MTNEMKFISGRFFCFELPKEKQYLLKYFKTDLEVQFLRYFYCFGQYEYFADHTGMTCQPRWLNILSRRLDMLVKVHAHTKKSIDLELLARIETGDMTLGEGFRRLALINEANYNPHVTSQGG